MGEAKASRVNKGEREVRRGEKSCEGLPALSFGEHAERGDYSRQTTGYVNISVLGPVHSLASQSRSFNSTHQLYRLVITIGMVAQFILRFVHHRIIRHQLLQN